MAHNPFPFTRDSHPDLTAAILGVVNESHTRAQLEKMSVTRLRELKKKYEGLVLKGDKGASRELADIRGLLRSKGAGVMVDEAVLHEGGVKAALEDFMYDLPPKAVAALRPVMGNPSIRGGTLRAKVGGILKQHGVPGMVLGGSSAQIVIDYWDTFHGDLDEARMVGDRVNANYAAMKKKKSGKTPVAEGMSPCEAAALKRLKSAEAADLKEYPGKKGEAAHKRLHKTIKSVVGEGVIGDTVQEDLQTPERETEMRKTGERLRRNISRAKTRKQYDAADKAHNKQQAQDVKEKRAKTVYGKGGKPVRKGSAEHKSAVDAKRAREKQTADSLRKSREWHRSQRGNKDHSAQMAGYDDYDHYSGARDRRDREDENRRMGGY